MLVLLIRQLSIHHQNVVSILFVKGIMQTNIMMVKLNILMNVSYRLDMKILTLLRLFLKTLVLLILGQGKF